MDYTECNDHVFETKGPQTNVIHESQNANLKLTSSWLPNVLYCF